MIIKTVILNVQCCLVIRGDILNFYFYGTDLHYLMILQGRPERLLEVVAAGASVSVSVVWTWPCPLAPENPAPYHRGLGQTLVLLLPLGMTKQTLNSSLLR